MATILVLGSVARDDVILLRTPMREGAHLEGRGQGARLGGGGANTALALARAGHIAKVVAPVGRDPYGAQMLSELDAAGADVSLVRKVAGQSTRSLVMVDEFAERTIVNLSRAREPDPPTRILGVEADALYVRSGNLNLADVMAAKLDEGLVVAHLPPCVDGCRPAHVLVASQSDLDSSQLAEPFALGRRVGGDTVKWVVITRGAAGADAYGRRAHLHADAPKVTPVDTTGCGDAFAAGLVHALVSGAEMADALAAACAWGAEATQWPASALPVAALKKLLPRAE